jgi:hypothetical protein
LINEDELRLKQDEIANQGKVKWILKIFPK